MLTFQPYLLSLGLSKSMLALVWIAGPLSGTLVQPYVGMKSDNCRLRWGRRRPFIIGGAIATILSLLILAWAREVVEWFLGIFGAQKESRGVQVSVMLFAVLFVYVLDFAINVSKSSFWVLQR
jgi:solute carrier family 45, member 1/2/4